MDNQQQQTTKRNVADPSTVPIIAGEGEQSAALILTEEVAELNTIMKMSHEIQQSGMFPQLHNKGQVLTVILAGRERDYPTITSLMNIHVINGRLGYSGAMIATELKKAKVEFEVLETDAEHCVIKFSRKGKSDFTYKWTMEDAKRAKKLPADPKSVWSTYPQDMFYWRCLTAGARKFAPDAIMGLHTKDELEDIREVTAVYETDPDKSSTERLADQLKSKVEPENVDKETGEVKAEEVSEKPEESSDIQEELIDPDKNASRIQMLMKMRRDVLVRESIKVLSDAVIARVVDGNKHLSIMVEAGVLKDADLNSDDNNRGHLARFIVGLEEMMAKEDGTGDRKAGF